MKKLIAIICLGLLLSASVAFAAGTVTQSLKKYPNANLTTLTFSCTGDASNGTVPNTDISAENVLALSGQYLYMVETDPGSTAPTTLYDIVINDASGLDVMGGTLANRSATATERAIPLISSGGNVYGGHYLDGTWTMVTTGQSVNSATWTVKLFFAR